MRQGCSAPLKAVNSQGLALIPGRPVSPLCGRLCGSIARDLAATYLHGRVGRAFPTECLEEVIASSHSLLVLVGLHAGGPGVGEPHDNKLIGSNTDIIGAAILPRFARTLELAVLWLA